MSFILCLSLQRSSPFYRELPFYYLLLQTFQYFFQPLKHFGLIAVWLSHKHTPPPHTHTHTGLHKPCQITQLCTWYIVLCVCVCLVCWRTVAATGIDLTPGHYAAIAKQWEHVGSHLHRRQRFCLRHSTAGVQIAHVLVTAEWLF